MLKYTIPIIFIVLIAACVSQTANNTQNQALVTVTFTPQQIVDKLNTRVGYEPVSWETLPPASRQLIERITTNPADKDLLLDFGRTFGGPWPTEITKDCKVLDWAMQFFERLQPEESTCPESPSVKVTPGVKEFKVTIAHTFYSTNTFTVNKGDTVRFLANAAPGTGAESGFSHNHGITIDEYSINQAVAVEDVNNPVAIEFVADRTGEFTIYCKTCMDGPFGAGHPAIQAKLIVNG